jgi:hypothetical protein
VVCVLQSLANFSEAFVFEVVVAQLIMRKVRVLQHDFERDDFSAVFSEFAVCHLECPLLGVAEQISLELQVDSIIGLTHDVSALGFEQCSDLGFEKSPLLELKCVFVHVNCWTVRKAAFSEDPFDLADRFTGRGLVPSCCREILDGLNFSQTILWRLLAPCGKARSREV